MKKSMIGMLFVCMAFFSWNVFAAKIKFSSSASKVKTSGKAKVTIKKKVVVSQGTLTKGLNATLEGNDITFNNGTLAQEKTSGPTTLAIGNGQYNANTGQLLSLDSKVIIDGKNDTASTFFGNSTLEGAGSMKTVTNGNAASNTTVAADVGTVVANGGTVTLGKSVTVTDAITGDARIVYDGNTLNISSSGVYTGNQTHENAADLEFNGKIILDGKWAFTGDGFVSGNGNLLDISNGGTIQVCPESSLYLTNLKLRGLGLGKIILDSFDSQLILSNVEIEMNRNYTVTGGNIYAEGPTNIVTKDYILLFDQKGSLSVDGIALTYDTLDAPNAYNIQPLMIDDPSEVHVASLEGGIIRQLNSSGGPTGDVHFTTDTMLSELFAAYPGRRMFIDEDLTLNGSTNLVLFSKSDSSEPLLFVAAGKTGVLENISLEYFSSDIVSLDAGAQLIFGDKTKISLAKNETLDEVWKFSGNCVINAENHILTLGPTGGILVSDAGSSLLIENAIIKGIAASNISCDDNTCTISFNNVTWIQDDNFEFAVGNFEVLSNFEINAPNLAFMYTTDRQSTIIAGATMTLAKDTIFSYAPQAPSDNRDLIAMEDDTASIVMSGATLVSTSTGLRLATGRLILDDKNYIEQVGVVNSLSEAVSFGFTSDPLHVSIMPGASINVLSGILDWNGEVATV